FWVSDVLCGHISVWLWGRVLALASSEARDGMRSTRPQREWVVERAADEQDRLPLPLEAWKVAVRDGRIVWLEYAPQSPFRLKENLEAARNRYPDSDLFFNLDAFPELEPDARLAITGVSGRAVFSADALNLDYDAFEELMRRWKPEL
ncbi:MAG: hypothetical protein RMM53_06685, partial [Bacteroidia bacterium]|nr:hypothetical protein [Bacteroidia bacterium]